MAGKRLEMMRILLAQPDRNTVKGHRDMTLMGTLYDSGCRVQELSDLKIRDVITGSPAVLVLTGKGGKTRRVPLMKNTVNVKQFFLG